MAFNDTTFALEVQSSYGFNLLDHLATDATGLLGGQVAVITLLQVNAHLVGSFHLETVETLASLGNNVLVLRHNDTPHHIHSGFAADVFAFARVVCAMMGWL
jgi:hypothetical protein